MIRICTDDRKDRRKGNEQSQFFCFLFAPCSSVPHSCCRHILSLSRQLLFAGSTEAPFYRFLEGKALRERGEYYPVYACVCMFIRVVI